MNKNRVVFAALAGGIAMYFWAAVAHMVLPLASIGIGEINHDEQTVLDSLHASLGNSPGMYHFPSIGWRPGDSSSQRDDAMKMYDAKLVSNPSGLLIYNPPGAQSITPQRLIVELLSELIEAALAIWMLAQTQIMSIAGRIGFVTLIGLLAAMVTNISYWNWYGFPASYTVSYMFTEIVGFAIAGAVAAFILPRLAPG